MSAAAAAVALVVGGFAFVWLSGGSGEPTTELTTPTLPDDPTTDAGSDTTVDTTAAPTTGAPTSAAPGGSTSFVISAEDSQARFEIDEELRGSPNLVVGTTGEVAGQVRFDPADLSTAEISEIVINARTFATDSGRRDRAMRSAVVLDSGSDEFELMTFQPRSVDGLPDQAEVGDQLSFTVTGDLTIKGVTMQTTFDVEATWSSEDSLEGIASTTVDRTDFGIGIPNVPSVANVSEEVVIALEFLALAG